MYPAQVKTGFTGINRRANRRYVVSRSMTYRLSGAPKDERWQQGTVLDMSASGIRFETGDSIPHGAIIDLMMDWPGIYHGRNEVRLSLSGTVCRSGADGTALRILEHDFRFEPVQISKRYRRTERPFTVALA